MLAVCARHSIRNYRYVLVFSTIILFCREGSIAGQKPCAMGQVYGGRKMRSNEIRNPLLIGEMMPYLIVFDIQ